MGEHTWWYVARTTGIVAWALASASVIIGMILSTRVLGRRPTGPWLLDLHRFTAGLSMLFVAIHLLGLWGDSYLHFAWREFLLPGASSYRPGAVTWGIVAGYALLIVQGSSMLMRRMPRRWWRAIHQLSFVSFISSSIHLWQSGTDAGNPVLRAGVLGSSGIVVLLLLIRFRRSVEVSGGENEVSTRKPLVRS
ncbi:MAG: hypothetical protein AB7N61_17475 [Acidimicrobiia bacterium]